MNRVRVVRTPEDRFADLPDFGYPPRYVDVGGLRLAYAAALLAPDSPAV